MFSAVLGLASAGIGAFASINQANQQAALAREQMELQRRALNQQEGMSMLSWGMAQDQLRREREQERYIREANERRDRTMGEEFGLRLDSQRARARMSQEERAEMVQRQIRLDRDAAEQRAFQLERFLENRSLAANERAFAVQQLEEARRIARGEADDDLRRYNEERLTAQEERDFAVAQMLESRDIARSERAQDMSVRMTAMERANSLQAALDAALRNLGSVRNAPEATRGDIEAEVMRREDQAVSDMDRAITRVASVNEADLMRRGLDSSSVATQRRGEVAERAANEYARVREAARDAALRYITGQQSILMDGFRADMGRRDRVMGETQAVASAGLDAILRLPQVRSANDFRAPVPIGSANFVRQTRSANDFRAPVPINTAIFEAARVGSGMGQTLNLPSAAMAQELNPGSRLAPQVQTWNITSPQGFVQSAMGGMQNVAGAYRNNADMYFNRSSQAAQAGGASLSQVVRSLGQLGDNWWNAPTASAPVSNAPLAINPPMGGGGGGGWGWGFNDFNLGYGGV